MRITRQQIEKITKEEYKKLLKECWQSEEVGHIHDESCGHEEHEEESGMFRSHLTSIAEQVEELESFLQQGDNVEEWIQEKMAVAAAAIDSIYHYMLHQDKEGDDWDDHGDEDEYEMDEQSDYVGMDPAHYPEYDYQENDEEEDEW